MLAVYPLTELLAHLEEHSRELDRASPEIPDALTLESGRYFLWKALWAPGEHLVIHFPVTFPDTLPKVYLQKNTPRPALVPHVNQPGQICCFEPSTVVNGTSPLEILRAVLEKARVIWTRTYTPEELLAEVEGEFTAYWESRKYPPLFICDSAIEHDRILGITDEVLPSRHTIHRLSLASQVRSAKERLAVIVEVPRAQLVDLLTDTEKTVRTLADLPIALETLHRFLRNGTQHKRTLETWLVLRCQTMGGPTYVGLQVEQRLQVDLRKVDFAVQSAAWIEKSNFRRVSVQDMRGNRLRARASGREYTEHLGNARVALAGCGSLGGFLADGLARAGVRQWLFLDPDILQPENLARHLLNFDALFLQKAPALANVLKCRFTDLVTDSSLTAVQTEAGKKLVQKFAPTLLVSATGDTNTDLTLSEACRKGELGDCCFLWVEPNLAAGHLVYQPCGGAHGLHDLHEQVGDDAYYYRHRILVDPRSLYQMEVGCQVAFTPYSGADMQLFAHAAVTELASILASRPTGLVVRRFKQLRWESLAV